MIRILGIFLFSLTLVTAATAASLFYESEEAFTASQAARNKGVEAFRADDKAAALVHMEAALTHRPGHPLLLGYVAYLAAETGDADRAYGAARQYAAMQIAPGAGVRDAVIAALDPTRAAEITAMFEANLAPGGDATVKFMLPADIRLVEGIAFAPNGTLFVGSVVSGGIWRMDATGPTQIVDAGQHESGSIFGMTFAHGALYATFAQVEQTPGFVAGEGQTGVVKVDPESGDILQVWALPGGTGGQQLADITATATGDIFVTDAQGKTVYRISGDTLFPLFSHDGFISPQGIAETTSGHLIMADYGRGLWLLDRETGAVTLLGVPATISLHGIDGLAAQGDRLIAIQNGVTPHRLLSVRLSDTGTAVESVTVEARALPDFDEPTLGAAGPDGLYFVAASQWPKYSPGGALKDGMDAAPTAIMMLGN